MWMKSCRQCDISRTESPENIVIYSLSLERKIDSTKFRQQMHTQRCLKPECHGWKIQYVCICRIRIGGGIQTGVESSKSILRLDVSYRCVSAGLTECEINVQCEFKLSFMTPSVAREMGCKSYR